MIKIISIQWVIVDKLALITETRRNKKGTRKYTVSVEGGLADCIGCPFNFGRCMIAKKEGAGWAYCTTLWQSPVVHNYLTGNNYCLSPKEIKRGY